MRISGPIATVILSLAACDRGGDRPHAAPNGASETPSRSSPPPGAANASAQRWDLQSSGEGTALALLSASGGTTIRLFCAAGANRLLVNVRAFRPVASEERLSFGGGGEVALLVADTRGDPQRGGVTGTGEVPANLAALVGGPVSVNHGAQNSGPHPAPPRDLSRAFVAACGEGPVAARPSGSPQARPIGPCLTQGSERLDARPLRAVGTEPFWGARIEGRCVTYSHIEDQQGTRVWTRFTPGPGGGVWSGALGGRRFEFRTRAEPGCSDGMSDKVYPIAVELDVGGERRRGCAEPLAEKSRSG